MDSFNYIYLYRQLTYAAKNNIENFQEFLISKVHQSNELIRKALIFNSSRTQCLGVVQTISIVASSRP